MYRLFASVIAVLISSNGLNAQPPLEPPPPAAKMKGPVGMGGQLLPPSHHPQPNEQELQDFRLRIFGGKKKNLPDNIDPELLKKLMEKLPKDKKVDPQQLEKMFQDNPQLKDPAFLKKLG